MARHDDGTSIVLTKDDEQARRLCALAVAFSNASKPVPSDTVRDTFYSDLSEDSFLRKFSRDRQKLVECGLVVRRAGELDGDATWQADSASFADVDALTPDDALLLDVLMSPLASDLAFARHSELRLALAKVDRTFGTLSAARISPGVQGNHATLSIMLGCMEQGKVAHITYRDAHGNRTERDVAPYGHFSLRGNTYFVCAEQKDGAMQLRTLRLGRILQVRETRESFVIPQDFCVDDHILLPFQLGPIVCEAVLEEGRDLDYDLRAQLGRRASCDEQGLWHVGASDVEGLAAWAIAAGMRCVQPTVARDAQDRLLAGAATSVAMPMPDRPVRAFQQQTAGRRGRQGGTSEMRELVALVGSLANEGAALNVDVVSARLGVTRERAVALLNLVLTACVGTSWQLPLGVAGDDGLVLTRSRGVSGRAIRLTPSETRALTDAFDLLGIDEDDPLRTSVMDAFAPRGFDEGEARQRVDDALGDDDGDVLEACSRCIVNGSWLAFDYQGLGQDSPTTRLVDPTSLRHDGGNWYLDAFDQHRNAMRTFRLDRMDNVRVRQADTHEDAGPDTPWPVERFVEVTFADARYLDLLEWPKLEVLGTSDDAVVTRLPYYGGSWLPRHLAACGGTARTSDDALAEAIREAALAAR